MSLTWSFVREHPCPCEGHNACICTPELVFCPGGVLCDFCARWPESYLDRVGR